MNSETTGTQRGLLSALLVAYFLSGFLVEITKSELFLRLGYAIGVVCFLAMPAIVGAQRAVKIGAAALVLALGVGFLGMLNGDFHAGKSILVLANVGAAVVLLAQPGGAVVALVPIVVWSVYFGGMWASGRPPDQIFGSEEGHWGTQNHVSNLMIGSYVAFRFGMRRSPAPLTVCAAVACALFCAWGRGRSGILGAGIIALGALYDLLGSGTRSRALKTVGWIGGSIALSAYLFLSIQSAAEWTERFVDKGMSDAGRLDIWAEYAEHLTPRNLLAGVPIQENAIFAEYDFNLHSSFLMLHSDAGVLAIPVLVAVAFGLLRLGQKSLGMAVASLGLIWRLLFDWFVFFSLNDYVVYPLVMLGAGWMSANSFALPRPEKRGNPPRTGRHTSRFPKPAPRPGLPGAVGAVEPGRGIA